MKSIWRFLFGKRLTHHPDTFALTREALWASIAKSIVLQQSMGKSVWLVAHFPDTYIQCQEMLESHGIDYFVETEPVNESWYYDRAGVADPQVRLFLADLLSPLELEQETGEGSALVALMVVERHPSALREDLVVRFAECIPAKVEVGYFLALDDELVQRMIPPQLIDLLKTMGMQEHDLISSTIVTRRLNKLIKRTTSEIEPGQMAGSASEWFEMNES